MKDLFRQAKMGLDREIDGFLQDYKLDEYQNLYDKSGITLISYNEDSLLDHFVALSNFPTRQVKFLHPCRLYYR